MNQERKFYFEKRLSKKSLRISEFSVLDSRGSLNRVKFYEYKHTVGFEETNLVGNVYYANFVRWQGRCREMFLRDYAPDILPKLGNGFAMVTTKVSCEYFNELIAFDDIVIKMRLGALKQNRIVMFFEYWRGGQLVARGEQEVACMMRDGEAFKPAAVPENLLSALREYL